MPEEMLEALFNSIEAKIDEKICDALGRDSLTETIKFGNLKQEFINDFVFSD